mgnify:CR=1 FL=1
MHQTFDKSVPLSKQRYLVAIKQCVRKKAKRHRVGKRKSALYRKRKAIMDAKISAQTKARHRYLQAARAYWSGDADVHP